MVTKPRRLRRVGHVMLIGRVRDAYKIFLGKPQGK
jgi:hypothetical protein